MIKDHPWLGCGPGNFQDFYTQYKLPEASEVVADPHNFVFEVWATAGTPALVGLLLFVAGAICDARQGQTSPNAQTTEATADVSGFALAGSVLGCLGAFVIGQAGTVPLSEPALVGGLALVGVSVAVLLAWVRAGRLPAVLLWLGAAVLAVNLLAAGGIGFPASQKRGQLGRLRGPVAPSEGGTQSHPPKVFVASSTRAK